LTESRGASLEVLFIVRDFPPRIGGRASLFRELARHSPPDSTRISTPWQWGAGAVDHTIPCAVHRAFTLSAGSADLGLQLWRGHLRRLCKKSKPGMILACGLAPEGQLALQLKREMDIPYLLHLESPQILSLRGREDDPGIGESELREVVAGSNGILVGSQACWLEAYRLGIYPQDLQKAPVAVDLQRFRPGERSEALQRKLRASEGPILLTVTGQAPIDEMETLYRAFAMLRATRKNAVLVLVGAQRTPESNKLARELHIEDGLRFLRSVPDAEMPELYRLADVFVLAGREDRKRGLIDGIQRSALEALASGVPVAGARTRTTEELITDGEVGILVEPGSPGKLARALQDVLRPQDRAAFGRAARSLAERDWEAGQAAAQIRAIFEVIYYRRLRRGTLSPAKDFVAEIPTLAL
jgi:phosphatidylinositol alpha-1,6-mannosyltransferase